MPIATGVFKKLSLKKQAALGTIAAAGAGGSARYMRRVTSTLDLAKAGYQSAEINTSQQVRDFRHGVRSVAGSISGELSVGGYQLPIESVLRKTAVIGGTTGVVANITIASSGAGTFAGTLTRAAGDYIAEGFKVGDVVRQTGGSQAANNAHNFLITALTALVMTVRTLDSTDLVAQGAAAGVTIAVAGKKTWVPAAGQTRDYYTIEHWYSDIGESERFVDCVFTGFNIGLPATGMATIEFPVMGLNMQTGAAEYFTTPAAAPVGPILAAANGALVVNGTVVADVTAMNIAVAGGQSSPGGVVGSNVDPDIFPGVLTATGSLTVLFRSVALRDLFLNETEFGVYAAFTGDNSAGAGFTAIAMPRVKATGNTKDDGQAGLSQTIPFQALENFAGGAGVNSEATTISVQDSAFV